LKARILGQMPVRCDEPAWSLWGISLAGWNLLASLVMGGICLAAFSRLRRPSLRGAMRRGMA
jgi:disulfide bond formation protein DsbB